VEAHAVNARGAGNLARAAAAVDIPLVHVSTDYVFKGEAPRNAAGAPRPYLESDPTGPRSVYGATKLAGERQVLAASEAHVVVRSSWLFGTEGHNFVATMLRLAAERRDEEPSSSPRETPAVQVVTDQIGCPTWTGHLAPGLLGLIEREVKGLVHLAGTGHVSWNGFAREIFRQAEVNCRVEPATTEQMPRPAPRPAWSALESEREDVLAMPDWRDGLAGYLAARTGMMRG
jgi:dTDP-4-dehydrorhamnose reductase